MKGWNPDTGEVVDLTDDAEVVDGFEIFDRIKEDLGLTEDEMPAMEFENDGRWTPQWDPETLPEGVTETELVEAIKRHHPMHNGAGRVPEQGVTLLS